MTDGERVYVYLGSAASWRRSIWRQTVVWPKELAHSTIDQAEFGTASSPALDKDRLIS